MGKKSQKDSLKEIVGDKVYSVWVDMLHRLVPNGRTHRLAPAIAAMLRYATEIASDRYKTQPEEGTVAHTLYILSEEADYEEVLDLLLPIVEKLLKDSGVEYKRRSSRGIEYSIAESAIQEFVNWYSLPWEY